MTVRVLFTRSVESIVDDARTKIPAVVEVGVKAVSAKVDCQAPFIPAAASPVTDRAPPVIVRFVPVISVIGKSEPIWIWVKSRVVVALSAELKALVNPVPDRDVFTTRVSMTEEVELREEILASPFVNNPLTLRDESKVEEAFTNIPFVVEVGDRALLIVPLCCQAPFCPGAPVPQAALAPATSPLVSTWRHWVEPVMVFKVNAPATVVAPFNLVVPSTAKVVLGAAVPIPTLCSEAFTTKVVVATVRPVFKVEVA